MHALALNKFFQGGVALMLSTVLINALNYFFYILIARTLGPRDYGEIVTLFSYLALFGTPFAILSTLLIRRLGYAGAKKIEVIQQFEQFFWQQIRKYGIPILILLIGFTPFLPRITNLTPASSFVLVLALMLGLVSMPYFAFVQGLHLFGTYSLIAILSTLLKFSGAFIVFLGIGDITIIYSGFLLSLLCMFLATLHKTRTFHTSPEGYTYRFQKNIKSLLLQRSTLYAFISLLGLTALGNIDVLYVKKFMSAHEAGLYGAWGLFAKTILYFLGPINSVLFIFFSEKETKDQQRAVLNTILILLVLVTLGAYFVYTIFEKQLIQIVLTNRFEGLSGLLSQAALFGAGYSLVTIMNNFFFS
ncbi:MAG: Polysaccharide biosynthesis protein [Microgenomates bacterium OLB22]|nr:MAG: Polysaccharide biosynthesis protein [Microgenomates bacterium OLB22]